MGRIPKFTADASLDRKSQHYRAGRESVDMATPLNAISPALRPAGAQTGGDCNASTTIPLYRRVLRGTYECNGDVCQCCSRGTGESLCIGCDGPGTCSNGHATEFPRSPVDFRSQVTVEVGGVVGVF